MCYQVVEFYSACRCLYYQHALTDAVYSASIPFKSEPSLSVTPVLSILSTRSNYDDSTDATGTLGTIPVIRSSRVARQTIEGRPGAPFIDKRPRWRRRADATTSLAAEVTDANEEEEGSFLLHRAETKAHADSDDGLRKYGRGEAVMDEKQSRRLSKSGAAHLPSCSARVCPLCMSTHEAHIMATILLRVCKTRQPTNLPTTFVGTSSPDTDLSGSDLSEAESILSAGSSTTTVDMDVLEAMFRRLLLHRDLRFLWPQAIRRSRSRSRSIRNIERFLRRYAVDLAKLAAKRAEDGGVNSSCKADSDQS